MRGRLGKKILVLFILAVLLTPAVHVLQAVSPTQISLKKIFYFKDNAAGRASLFAHSGSIDILSPQSYSIDDTGALAGSIAPDILSFAKANGIKVMPLVTNKAFSKSIAGAILSDVGKQNSAIKSLVEEAKKNGYAGWQFDFEGMDSSMQKDYSAFVKRAGRALHQNKLTFSVAVIAQISNDPDDYPKDLWQRVIGVYDYSSLGTYADFLSLMSYDDPDSKGPISPYPWLDKVIRYATSQVPANKLSLGLPLYYWKWDDGSGKLVGVGGYSGIQNVLARKYVYGYDQTNKEPYLKYTVGKNHYTLWYENSKSVADKMTLLKSYGLQGFSAWVLGLEVPSVYQSI